MNNTAEKLETTLLVDDSYFAAVTAAIRSEARRLLGIELSAEPGLSAAEHAYAALWQRYFQHHAIAERHNPGLQQKHVPLRYRKHLAEFTAP